jgi:hypothetical protein
MSWRYDRSYDWSKHLIKLPKDIPSYKHFVVMIFEQRSYSEAGYDPGDRSTIGYYQHMDYYAFKSEQRDLWEKFISAIYTERHNPNPYGSSKEEIVFFESSSRGEVDVKINVNVNIK